MLINRTGAAGTSGAIRDQVLRWLVPGYAPAHIAIEPRGAPAPARGRWVGSVSTYVGEIPLSVTADDGGVVADLGDVTGIPVTVEPYHEGQGYDLRLTLPVQLPTRAQACVIASTSRSSESSSS